MRLGCNILCKKMILQIANYSFNPNLGGLFRGSFCGGRGLEIWYVSTHTFNSRKYTFSTKNTLIFLISAFFLQKIIIFGKNSTYTQSNSMTAVLLLMKTCFTNDASGIGLPDCSKLAIIPKNYNDVTICQHEVIVIFLTLPCFSN